SLRYQILAIEIHTLAASAAPLLTAFAASAVDEDAPHGLGCRGEEMAAAVPLLSLLRVYQPQVRFMDQGRGLQGLTRFLLRQPLRRQLAQLVIHQRQQMLRGGWVAGFDGVQDVGDVGHVDEHIARGRGSQAVVTYRSAIPPCPVATDRRVRPYREQA